MLDTVFLKKAAKNTAIIIRHSDRDDIPEGVPQSTVGINEKGRTNSELLGSRLMQFNSIKIFCSPIKRCGQTGEMILKGANKQGEIIESNMLGEPGPFVFDRNLGREIFHALGCKTVIEKQIEGEIFSGIRPLKEGSENLKNFIVAEMNNNAPDNLLIFITHDAIIAPFIYYYTGEKFNEEHWIDFTDGVAIVEEDNSFCMIRNGIEHEIH